MYVCIQNNGRIDKVRNQHFKVLFEKDNFLLLCNSHLQCLGNFSIYNYFKLTKALFWKSLPSWKSLPKSFIVPLFFVRSVIWLCWYWRRVTFTEFPWLSSEVKFQSKGCGSSLIFLKDFETSSSFKPYRQDSRLACMRNTEIFHRNIQSAYQTPKKI